MKLNMVNKEKIIFLIAPIIIALFLYFILVPPLIIAILLIVIYSILLIYPQIEKRVYKDLNKEAWLFCVDWWWKFRKEKLDTMVGQGLIKDFYMPNETVITFIAFRINRSKKEGLRKGQPLILVVEYKDGNYHMKDWDDSITSTSDRKWVDPFYDVVPVIMRRAKIGKKEEEKKKKEEEEDSSEEGEVEYDE